jgi:flagellar hook-associated protein 1 FlgK
MSLTSSFQIGRSALSASQIALQVAGDNIANAATPGFTRRVVSLAAVRGQTNGNGITVGRGVELQAVRRQIDTALESRLRDALGQHTASLDDQSVLQQIEALVSDLDGAGLSSQLSKFFNSFSELANNPSAAETRAVIVQQGVSLASFVRRLRSDLSNIRAQIDTQVGTLVERADGLLSEIAGLNRSITNSEQGRAENPALRDRRDALLSELSTLIEVSTIEQPGGAVDVYVGSTPLVVGAQAKGLTSRTRTVDGEVRLEVLVADSQEKIVPDSGRVGALLRQRNGATTNAIDDLDGLASNLIFEVNKLHAAGRSFPGLTDTTGWQQTPLSDQTLALNDPQNATWSALPFAPRSGVIAVLVTDKATGLVERREIAVDLDGIDAAGAPGYSGDTTLQSLVADLDSVPNLSAAITADGRVRVTSDPGFEFGFESDSSGALAALGINTYFTGTNAQDIGVRDELQAAPQLVVAGIQPGSNEVALAIAGLRSAGVEALDGVSLDESWRRVIERVSVDAAAAETRAEASDQVRQSLEAQRSAISGVSIDEESLNLISYQRQYQAAARFISTIDDLTQVLLQLV